MCSLPTAWPARLFHIISHQYSFNTRSSVLWIPCYRGTNVTSFLANLNARTRKGKCFGASQLPSMPSGIRLNNANSRLLRIKFHYKLSKPYSVVAYLTPATIQGRQQIDSFRTPARQHCVKQALQNVCFVINFI